METEPDPDLVFAVSILVDAVLFLPVIVLGWWLWRVLRATSLLFSGDYAAARPLWEKYIGSRLWGMDASARYNVAYCLHHEGKLEEALTALRDLEARHPRGVIAGIRDTLLGSTLLLLDRDHAEASARMERGDIVFPNRHSWLFRAHAALSLGDEARAADLVRTALTMPEPPSFKLGVVSARVDRTLQGAVGAYLLGWYHERLGDTASARSAYESAAATPRESIYVRRAREALERMGRARVEESDEGPSSLSPLALP
ncbi:MAG: tetratricopeptide repeat protein [Minicystis sp.]